MKNFNTKKESLHTSNTWYHWRQNKHMTNWCFFFLRGFFNTQRKQQHTTTIKFNCNFFFIFHFLGFYYDCFCCKDLIFQCRFDMNSYFTHLHFIMNFFIIILICDSCSVFHLLFVCFFVVFWYKCCWSFVPGFFSILMWFSGIICNLYMWLFFLHYYCCCRIQIHLKDLLSLCLVL